MTHDLDVNFNGNREGIAELRHENSGHVGRCSWECGGACRALNQSGAATTKKFDTKGIIQFEHVDHEQIAEKKQALVKTQEEELNTMMNEARCVVQSCHGTNDQESMDAMTAVEITEKLGLHNSRHRQ